MSFFKNFSRDEYKELEKYCQENGIDLNITKKIEEVFRLKELDMLLSLQEGKSSFSISNFNNLVCSFFKALDFSFGEVDDRKLMEIKENIGEAFKYFDSLDLDFKYKEVIFKAFISNLNSIDFSSLINSKGIYDLLTYEPIRNSKIVREFVELRYDSLYAQNSSFTSFVLNLYKLLDKFDLEDVNKINYVFLSSNDTLLYFKKNPSRLKYYFNEGLIHNFSKETLSFLFRTELIKNSDFCDSDDKFFVILSEMSNYMLNTTGNNVDLFDGVFSFFDYDHRDTLIDLFVEYYDKFYINKKEKKFERDEVFKGLLAFVLDYGKNISFLYQNDVYDLESFFELKRQKIDKLYNYAFGKDGVVKLKYDVFDVDDDFSFSNKNLRVLKEIFLRKIYGVSLENAAYLKAKYGVFLDKCESEFLDEDKSTFNLLKSILNIYNLSLSDTDQLKEVLTLFCRNVTEKGFYDFSNDGSFSMIQALVNRMFMNTYNNILYLVDENASVLYSEDGVLVVDPGVEFNMIVSSVNGVGDFFRNTEGYAYMYNSSYNSSNHGICSSFISNENLGVVVLNKPLIGYTNLDKDSLDAMGIGDIYSSTDSVNLRRSNSEVGEGRFFLTPKQLTNYTRFGYNEMVFNRFLSNDDDNRFKVQPSYVVAYKIDDKYKKTKMYKESLKMAKEFGVPLVLIDVPKVKEHEKKVISEKENELFNSKAVNKDLVIDIITRYMNNYSGSLTICRSRGDYGNNWNYKKDFSILGINRFLRMVRRKVQNFDIDKINEWCDALTAAYELEEEKNALALVIEEYEYSLKDEEFLLDDKIYFMDKVSNIRESSVYRKMLEDDLLDVSSAIFVPVESESMPKVETILNLSNEILRNSYCTFNCGELDKIVPSRELGNLSEGEKNAAGLVISYFLGDYGENYFSNLCECNLSNIYFRKNYMSLYDSVGDSPVYNGKECDDSFLLRLTEHFTRMEDEDFVKLFEPLIDMAEGKDFWNEYEEFLLEQKNCMTDIFSDFFVKKEVKKETKVKK